LGLNEAKNADIA